MDLIHAFDQWFVDTAVIGDSGKVDHVDECCGFTKAGVNWMVKSLLVVRDGLAEEGKGIGGQRYRQVMQEPPLHIPVYACTRVA